MEPVTPPDQSKSTSQTDVPVSVNTAGWRQVFDIEKLFVLIMSTLLLVYVLAIVANYDGWKNSLITKSSDRTADHVAAQVQTDLADVARQAERFTANQTFDQFIESRNLLQLADVTDEEKRKSGLDVLIVVDDDGVALTRTPGQQERGDFIFDTAPYGATLLVEEQVETIVHHNPNSTLLLGGSLAQTEDRLVGAVLAGRNLDTEYALQLQRAYQEQTGGLLSSPLFGGTSEQVEIIFYANQSGIIAQTFTDSTIANLVHENFDTTFLTNGDRPFPLSRVTIDGVQYNVRDTELPSSDAGRIGVLTLTKHQTVVGNLVHAGLAVAAFILLMLPVVLIVRPFRSTANRVLALGLLLVLGIGLFILFFFKDISVEELFFDVKKPAYPIYNSTMMLEPSDGVFAVQFEQRIAIAIESGGEPINAAKAEVFFDPQAVRVEEIITTNSFCEPGLFIEREIDNEAGVVTISCGIRTPGFTGRSAIVAELVVQPLEPGSFELLFGDETAVFANDGLGTQVLRFALDGSYIVTDLDDTESLGDQLLLFSRTHSNSERWYNTPEITFSWRKNGASEYRYAFDQRPFTQPDGSDVTSENTQVITAPSDGIYYFHLQEERDGEGVGDVVHYKVQIDTTPPEPPAVRVSETTIKVGDIARFEFGSSDEGSGLQKNYYYVSINDGVLLPVQPPLYSSFPTPGTHTVKIRVFDNAENISDTIIEMNVVE